MFKNLIFLFIVLSLIWIYISACRTKQSTQNIKAVENFKVDKYLGDWYEIARMPHYFEKDMEFVKANYSLNYDGTIKVINSGIKDNKLKSVSGIAKFAGDKNIGELKVSFFRPFWGEYKIIYLTEDYSLAIVTSSNKDYLWLLSRTPTINEDSMNLFIDKAILWGFDIQKLIYPQQ